MWDLKFPPNCEHGILPPLSALPDSQRAAIYARLARNGTWYTPTLVVVTRNNYQVVGGTKDGANDSTKLGGVVEGAIAQTKVASAAH